ncbi:g1802 [Coccomyxa viridis]|uniref:G1802 protein n=1 Tax=Coccomyxa viridis TaxID=1274662 RepID=A0ABP1FIT6_9CHLO
MSFDDFNTVREAQRAPGLSSLAPAMVIVPPNIGKAEAVRAFKAHADSTNDIFHIAAQVIARVILEASKAVTATSTPGKIHDICTSALPGQPLQGCEVSAREATPQENWAALQEAWKPFKVAWKAPWWDSAATPEDMTPEAFREGRLSSHTQLHTYLRGLAEDSLTLLKEFLYDERFPALFDLEVYGSIIGMFELNNLSLYVASPVEDYALACTADTGSFDPGEQHMAQLLSRPVLNGLGDSYDAACEGSCFYALQSCLNHSCAPNAHAFKRKNTDTDGSAVILAKQDIASGEEVSLSYIDESMPYHERQAALKDYGFTCACTRCSADAAPAGKAKA